ncbi:hypothetical protein B0H12DRAFT_110484 [Mycena haematopus]|nr:hypothetical protein B0H12DRAFT_110484 [Mycena haematopus]
MYTTPHIPRTAPPAKPSVILSCSSFRPFEHSSFKSQRVVKAEKLVQRFFCLQTLRTTSIPLYLRLHHEKSISSHCGIEFQDSCSPQKPKICLDAPLTVQIIFMITAGRFLQ